MKSIKRVAIAAAMVCGASFGYTNSMGRIEIPASYKFQADGHVLIVNGDDIMKMNKTHYLVIRYDAVPGRSIESFKPMPGYRFWRMVEYGVEGDAWKYTYELAPTNRHIKTTIGNTKRRLERQGASSVRFRIPFMIRDNGLQPSRRKQADIVSEAAAKGVNAEERTFYFQDPGPACWISKKETVECERVDPEACWFVARFDLKPPYDLSTSNQSLRVITSLGEYPLITNLVNEVDGKTIELVFKFDKLPDRFACAALVRAESEDGTRYTEEQLKSASPAMRFEKPAK